MNTFHAILLSLLAAVIASLPVEAAGSANPFLLLYTMSTDDVRKLPSAGRGMENDHNLELNELLNNFFVPLVKDCSIVEVQTIMNHFNSNSDRKPYIQQIMEIINDNLQNSLARCGASRSTKTGSLEQDQSSSSLNPKDPGLEDLKGKKWKVWNTIRDHREITMGRLIPVLDASLAGFNVKCIKAGLVEKFENAVYAVTDKIEGWLVHPKERNIPYATYGKAKKALEDCKKKIENALMDAENVVCTKNRECAKFLVDSLSAEDFPGGFREAELKSLKDYVTALRKADQEVANKILDQVTLADPTPIDTGPFFKFGLRSFPELVRAKRAADVKRAAGGSGSAKSSFRSGSRVQGFRASSKPSGSSGTVGSKGIDSKKIFEQTKAHQDRILKILVEKQPKKAATLRKLANDALTSWKQNWNTFVARLNNLRRSKSKASVSMKDPVKRVKAVPNAKAKAAPPSRMTAANKPAVKTGKTAKNRKARSNLSHCCTLARSVVGGRVVNALLLRPLLHITQALATEASRHHWDNRSAEPGPFSFSALVAIRCCIDLRCTFDIRGLDFDDAVTAIKSIPTLFPIECLVSKFDELGEPLLDHLVTDAVNAYCGDGTVKPGFTIALVPFDIRFAFWKDLMETPKTRPDMYLLTRSFDPVQAEAAFNYLEYRIRLFTESYDMVENEAMEKKQESYDSDREYYDNEPVEAMKQKPWLPSVLVEALVSLLPALAARSMEMVRQAWEHICVLVFTAKASFPYAHIVPDCVSASSDWIVFWKQFVIHFLDGRDFGDASRFIEHLRSVDVDGVAEAKNALLQAFQEREVNKSGMHDYRAFIVRQLRLLEDFCCSVVNLEHAPKIIAALADIGRTIGNLQFKAKIWTLLESCVFALDDCLYELLTALNGPRTLPGNVDDDKIKIKFQLDVEELVHFYIDVQQKYGVELGPFPLAVLPICGSKDLHLTYIRSTVKLERKVNLTKLCSLLSGERFRTAFVLAIDMVGLELLDCLCQNKLELHRQNLLEHCIPILVSQLNKQKGVGKLISRLAPDMNESMLIEILDAILLILPQYSLETSMDLDIHELGFPAVIAALAQHGFSARIQPLVQFLYNIIALDRGMYIGFKIRVLILESVIRHLSPIKFADMALLWKRSYEFPEVFTETLATASAKQMAGLINTKSASISDVERLLIAALEHAQQEYHLRSGILVMKVVRQLHQSVVGSPTVSPSITGSLLSLLVAYLSQPEEIHDPSSVPDKPEIASPELDFVTQMLAPASGLVYEEAVACCLREVWVQATFCRSARFVYLTRSEEAGFGFRRVLSGAGEVIAAWKDALERKEEWYMEVSFGERVKMLCKKYGLVWANE
ncbi:hypothetical protein DFJ73DRAFT_942029 [Zopfochytrium polystomum]|nr:hypothetical protein DFJ73DRAFT_942029 [Zopfochytrium polystomum]